MKEDVFMALPVSGGIYTFQCLGAENMFLNLYYYNGISNGQNVILWGGDGSKEQQWKFDEKNCCQFVIPALHWTSILLPEI